MAKRESEAIGFTERKAQKPNEQGKYLPLPNDINHQSDGHGAGVPPAHTDSSPRAVPAAHTCRNRHAENHSQMVDVCEQKSLPAVKWAGTPWRKPSKNRDLEPGRD